MAVGRRLLMRAKLDRFRGLLAVLAILSTLQGCAVGANLLANGAGAAFGASAGEEEAQNEVQKEAD